MEVKPHVFCYKSNLIIDKQVKKCVFCYKHKLITEKEGHKVDKVLESKVNYFIQILTIITTI